MAEYISFEPADFFNVKLWTGNSTTDRAMTGVGFQPDLLWVKGLNEGTDQELNDSVRGSTKYIRSNLANVEGTETESVKSFDTDGYTLGDANYWNWTAKTFVGWSWKGGTTSGITTNGSTTITPSSYSFNQTSGFSILAYTGNITSGAKLAHGLGATPSMIICKGLDYADSWAVGHQYTDATDPWDYAINLDAANARSNSDAFWNDTAPDSVNITLGNGDDTNRAADMVAYCFAEKQGYSKISIYEGNGDADGTFTFTGFRPAWIMIRRADSGDNWNMYDSKREGYNVDNDYVKANSANVEASDVDIDILSNGFKCRTADAAVNASGGDYTYIAIAENPLVSTGGAAVNAR